MIEMATEVIVLCDSSKFGGKAFARVAPVTKVGRIITDSGIDPEALKAFKAKDVLIEAAEA